VERTILMATLFTLVLHLTYFRALIDGDKRYAALAVAAYMLAVFSKEHSVMAPAILLLLTWVLRERIKLSRKALLCIWLGFFVVALIALMRQRGIFGQTYEMDAAAMFGLDTMLKGLPMLHLLSALTQAGLFFKYCLLMLIPNPAWMSVDMREPFILSWRDWTSWIGLLAFVSYGITALICVLRGGRVALFGIALLYPWTLFITEFSTIRIQEVFVLYRSYLWLPGFMLFLPLLFSTIPDRKIMLAGGVAVLLLVPLAWNRLWVFADNYRMWSDAVQLLHGENRLGANRTYYNRGYFAGRINKDWESAIVDYQKSLQLNSSFPEVGMALALAYSNVGRNAEALAMYDHAIALEPKDSQAYYEKAMLLKRMQDNKGAVDAMQKSCDLGKNLACTIVGFNNAHKH
jgi:hypothetical protein